MRVETDAGESEDSGRGHRRGGDLDLSMFLLSKCSRCCPDPSLFFFSIFHRQGRFMSSCFVVFFQFSVLLHHWAATAFIPILLAPASSARTVLVAALFHLSSSCPLSFAQEQFYFFGLRLPVSWGHAAFDRRR